MESAHYETLGTLALQQGADALSHLVGRLVGKGDRGNIARRIAAPLHQMGDLQGDHARLAAARTGQHQQGAVEISYRFVLRCIGLVQHLPRIGADSAGARFNAP
jgi:hypothetical protein